MFISMKKVVKSTKNATSGTPENLCMNPGCYHYSRYCSWEMLNFKWGDPTMKSCFGLQLWWKNCYLSCCTIFNRAVQKRHLNLNCNKV